MKFPGRKKTPRNITCSSRTSPIEEFVQDENMTLVSGIDEWIKEWNTDAHDFTISRLFNP